MTIREMCDKKVELFRDLDSLSPEQIAQEVVELSSLWASINKELIDRKCWYAEKKKQLLVEHGKGNLATIHAEASPEYRAMLEAEAYSKSIQEMIRSGRYYIRLSESAQRESKY